MTNRYHTFPHLFISSNSISVPWLSFLRYGFLVLPNKKIKIPEYRLVKGNRSDGYDGAAIAIKNSINFRELDINPNLSQLLADHNIKLVSVKIFSIYDQVLDLWLCYIPPHANISQVILNNIFNVMSILQPTKEGTRCSTQNSPSSCIPTTKYLTSAITHCSPGHDR